MAEKGTILVVDNESDQLDMMREILGRIGFDARTTDNPQQALKMVEKHAFSLVIIDLIMSDDLYEMLMDEWPTTADLGLLQWIPGEDSG